MLSVPLWPLIALVAIAARPALAADSPLATTLQRGDYADVLAQTETIDRTDARAAEARLHALLAVGRYEDAAIFAAQNVRRFRADPAVQFAAYEAFRAIGEGPVAATSLMLAARTQPGGYDPRNETPAAAAARAKALQLLGADPKLVLDRILTAATKTSPDAREPYLALAGIALDKRDFRLAADTLREAARRFPNDADIEFALARTYEAPKPCFEHLTRALEANPRLVPALVFKAEKLTDLGDFDGAAKALDAAIAVNPASPTAWAARALVAQMKADEAGAATARAKALEPWADNPEVDYAIGAGLARQYRFAEGIAALRAALEKDPAHRPAMFELGSNLLRYGDEKEGWKLIETVQERDPYHVAAFNLVTLRDTMAAMKTLTGPGVALRMAPDDAAIFGPRALDLCVRARRALADKYGVTLPWDVRVDLLPTQQDFAVRTFTLPGGEGFLGVCFGPLITACSPRGRLGRANWEAVLWHEMAHTITLTGTRHRIPRWLSEGLSVHEERLTDPGWGMGMNTERRTAILEGKLRPIRDLDAAFREDIDLAYFHASLVVDFLVERFGNDGIRRLLAELGRDRTINQALETVAGPPGKMQADFEAYARAQADAYGRDLDWRPLDAQEFTRLRADPAAFLAASPSRYFAVMQRARDLAREQKWTEVKALVEPLVALEPSNREPENPLVLLAEADRALGDRAAERTALEQHFRLDAGALATAERLLALATEARDDAAVPGAAARVLAINPAHPDALLALGRTTSRGGDLDAGIASYEALLTLDPVERVRLRVELARVLEEKRDPRARRQILLALAENPRFEPALRLLQSLPRPTPAGAP